MSDENDQQDQQDDIKGIRAQLEALREENKALKSDRRQRVYRDAGIPEAAHDIFDKTYDGELTPEALRDYAEAKGFRLGGNDEAADQAAAQQVDETQQAREQGQNRLDEVDAAKLPTEAPSTEDQIREAQAAGDWTTSFNLKSQLLDESRRARRDAGAAI